MEDRMVGPTPKIVTFELSNLGLVSLDPASLRPSSTSSLGDESTLSPPHSSVFDAISALFTQCAPPMPAALDVTVVSLSQRSMTIVLGCEEGVWSVSGRNGLDQIKEAVEKRLLGLVLGSKVG